MTHTDALGRIRTHCATSQGLRLREIDPLGDRRTAVRGDAMDQRRLALRFRREQHGGYAGIGADVVGGREPGIRPD